MSQLTYTVIVESNGKSFGAYVPDLPGCVAVGDSVEEVTALIREAIHLHLETMIQDGDPIPPPTSRSISVQTDVAA